MYSLSIAGKTALIIFPIIALLSTVPFMIGQYQKHGSVSGYRYLVVFSFIFYLLMMYFLVILPLPDRGKVYKPCGYNLHLFSYLPEIAERYDFNSTSGIMRFLKNAIFLEPVLNVIMFVPLGIYLRYYWHKPFHQVFLISFFISLFFELTQLSGLYGIYESPYRLFDVNDLLENTLGGVVGYLICPAFMSFLPSLKSISNRADHKGNTVTLTRRALAFYLDLIICSVITIGILKVFADKKTWKVVLLIYGVMYVFFLLQQLVSKGMTIGKHAVRITVVDRSGQHAKWWQYMIRTFIRTTILMQGCMTILLCQYMPSQFIHKAKVLCALGFVFCWCVLLFDGWVATLREHRTKVLTYEIITHTITVSTISMHTSIAKTRKEEESQFETESTTRLQVTEHE